MPARLPRGPRDLNCEATRQAKKMPFARAMHDCTYGLGRVLADRLGRTKYSHRTVESWGNFADPQRAPTEVLAECMATSIEAGKPRAMALAPLFHLCEIFGGEFVERVPDGGESDMLRTVDRLGADALTESGEAIAALVEAARDRRLTPAERRRLRKEIADARRAWARIERFANQQD